MISNWKIKLQIYWPLTVLMKSWTTHWPKLLITSIWRLIVPKKRLCCSIRSAQTWALCGKACYSEGWRRSPIILTAKTAIYVSSNSEKLIPSTKKKAKITWNNTKKKINWPFSLRVIKSRLPGTVKNKRPISSISRVMPRWSWSVWDSKPKCWL